MKEASIVLNKKNPVEVFTKFLEKAGNILEILFILAIWYYIFSYSEILGDFVLNEMIAYLLVANLIGLFTSFLLHKTVKNNLGMGDSKMLYYKPFRYISRVLYRTLKKIFIPFIFSISLNILLLYLFVDNIYFDFDFSILLLVFVVIILAFLTELLLALIFDAHAFWLFESRYLASMINRIKKILAGAYFPLGFLGSSFLMISIFLPFAYSFYVPAQLFLREMSFEQGLLGVSIQLIWIAIFYVILKISWRKKEELERKIIKRKSILE